MGYEVDVARLTALAGKVGSVGEVLDDSAERTARLAVTTTDFGGDRYTAHGDVYRGRTEELARQVGDLAAAVSAMSVQLREVAAAYSRTEEGNTERLESEGSGLGTGGGGR